MLEFQFRHFTCMIYVTNQPCTGYSTKTKGLKTETKWSSNIALLESTKEISSV